MPTILSHAIAAVALGQVPSSSTRFRSIRFWVLTAFCSMLPDVDVIGFAFGVRYADVLGHRGLTHSFFFAAVVGCAAAAAYGGLFGGSARQDPPSVPPDAGHGSLVQAAYGGLFGGSARQDPPSVPPDAGQGSLVQAAYGGLSGGSARQDPPSVPPDAPSGRQAGGGRVLFFGPGARMTWFRTGGALALYFAAITATHPLLDALTDGGLGVALFAPFSPDRYFLPWRPIEVSPIGPSFFSERGFHVLISEIRWVWLPSLALVLICRRFAKTG